MDIFTLDKTTYVNGRVINGLTDKVWIERYLEPGEFTITCPATQSAMNALPLGTLISHGETREVMMVENYEIVEGGDDVPVLTITGRSVDSFLENRISSGNNFGEKNPITNAVNLYNFLDISDGAQAAQLISEHIISGQISGADILPNVGVLNNTSQLIGTTKQRVVKRGDLYKELIKILESRDFGIKTERPVNGGNKLNFILHEGSDLSSYVQFSHESGEIVKARYFMSIRKIKNSALVMGEFTSKVIRPAGVSGWDARAVLIDAKDFDMRSTESALDLEYIDDVLTQRGNEVLTKLKSTRNLIVPTIAKVTRYKYRKDYNVGDTIYVYGNYGVRQKMRVTEYIETEDAKGEYGYPTLAAL